MKGKFHEANADDLDSPEEFASRTRAGDYVWRQRLGHWTFFREAGEGSDGEDYVRHWGVLASDGLRLTIKDRLDGDVHRNWWPSSLIDLPDLLEAIILEGNYER